MELVQTAPPIFRRAAITLGIGPSAHILVLVSMAVYDHSCVYKNGVYSISERKPVTRV